MKKILFGAAVAAVLAAPAFAQSGMQNNGVHTGKTSVTRAAGDRAYAYAPGRDAAAWNGSDVVYANGQYAGRDPDPNVRLDLRRDVGR